MLLPNHVEPGRKGRPIELGRGQIGEKRRERNFLFSLGKMNKGFTSKHNQERIQLTHASTLNMVHQIICINNLKERESRVGVFILGNI
jgi:hypothetical protein